MYGDIISGTTMKSTHFLRNSLRVNPIDKYRMNATRKISKHCNKNKEAFFSLNKIIFTNSGIASCINIIDVLKKSLSFHHPNPHSVVNVQK